MRTKAMTATHKATIDGETVYFTAETMTSVLDALVTRHPGAGAPKVESVQAGVEVSPKAESVAPPAPPASSVYSTFGAGGQVVDAAAKSRIEAQHAALVRAGVAVNADQQLYETGTRMAREGYAEQERRSVEHNRKAALADVAQEIASRVEAEHREDAVVTAREFANALRVNGAVTAFGLKLREQAIRGVMARTESPALGYVLGLRDRVAAERAKPEDVRDQAAVVADKAKIADVLRHECMRNPDAKLKLRCRKGAPQDIFTVVSPSYGVADAPQALGRLLDGLPRDARGSYAYDPVTTCWELRASVWTPTPAAEQAVGEAFEGYVAFTSRDDGTGSFKGGGGVTLLRCLNASTYTASSSDVRRRHVGDVLGDVGAMLKASLTAIDTLCALWGNARQGVLDLSGDLYVGMPMHQILGGILFAELRNPKGELSGVLPGRSAEHARSLATVYATERRDPERLVRADIGQAWTRYIQDQPATVRREAERAIGSWLAASAPIRYEAIRD